MSATVGIRQRVNPGNAFGTGLKVVLAGLILVPAVVAGSVLALADPDPRPATTSRAPSVVEAPPVTARLVSSSAHPAGWWPCTSMSLCNVASAAWTNEHGDREATFEDGTTYGVTRACSAGELCWMPTTLNERWCLDGTAHPYRNHGLGRCP